MKRRLLFFVLFICIFERTYAFQSPKQQIEREAAAESISEENKNEQTEEAAQGKTKRNRKKKNKKRVKQSATQNNNDAPQAVTPEPEPAVSATPIPKQTTEPITNDEQTVKATTLEPAATDHFKEKKFFGIGTRAFVDVFQIFAGSEIKQPDLHVARLPIMPDYIGLPPAWGLGVSLAFNCKKHAGHAFVTDVLMTFDNTHGFTQFALQGDWHYFAVPIGTSVQFYLGVGLGLSINMSTFAIKSCIEHIYHLTERKVAYFVPGIRLPLGFKMFLKESNLELFLEADPQLELPILYYCGHLPYGAQEENSQLLMRFSDVVGLSLGVRTYLF